MLSLLGFACRDDELEVRNILMSNPACDINGRGAMGYACLHHACEYGADRIVSLLLAHPDINVNQKHREGTTPFMVACSKGKTSCASAAPGSEGEPFRAGREWINPNHGSRGEES